MNIIISMITVIIDETQGTLLWKLRRVTVNMETILVSGAFVTKDETWFWVLYSTTEERESKTGMNPEQPKNMNTMMSI